VWVAKSEAIRVATALATGGIRLPEVLGALTKRRSKHRVAPLRGY
jgi:hypothetical protein